MLKWFTNIFKPNKYLVITTTGQAKWPWKTWREWAEDEGWLNGTTNFDLTVVEGNKWEAIYNKLIELGPKLDQYEAVWMPDPDVNVSAKEVCDLFDFFSVQNFQIAHPAICVNSFSIHEFMEVQYKNSHRFVNFVDLVAPMFSRKALDACLPTFLESKSGAGLDWVWPKLMKYDRVALIDRIPITHRRKPEYDNAEQERLTAKYKIYFPFFVQFSASQAESRKVCKLNLTKNLVRGKRPWRRENGCSYACQHASPRFMNVRTIR